jgi:hypothetical protein
VQQLFLLIILDNYILSSGNSYPKTSAIGKDFVKLIKKEMKNLENDHYNDAVSKGHIKI